MLIPRKIERAVEGNLFGGKVIIIYGARRVGKTTLVKDLLKRHKGVYLNCDEPDIRAALSGKTSTELANYVQDSKLVVIDEAQRVRDVGLTLKLMVDNLKDAQIVATGSSSFDLSNKTKESLTGRSVEFLLTPLMISEVNKDSLEATRLLEQRLRYGFYPDAVIEPGNAEETLRSIVNNFLYKDALEFSGLKNPETVERLVTALALQIGQEVSYTELAN